MGKKKMQTLMNLKERAQWIIDHVAEENNLSNSKIGGAVGSKPDTVRKYRSGEAVPRLTFIKRFCDYFGVDYQWFSRGGGEPFPGKNIQSAETSDAIQPAAGAPVKVIAQEIEEASSGREIVSFPEKMPATTGTREEFLTESGADAENKPFDVISGMDCEMSFQKLAVLAGIKIDNEWVFNLSKKVGIESWKISLSIYYQKMDKALVQCVEDCGYERHDWLVKLKAEHAGPVNGNWKLNISQLLKITEEVLRSNTIHSTSLSLNIISFKMLADQKTSAPVRGAKAVIF